MQPDLIRSQNLLKTLQILGKTRLIRGLLAVFC